jgi:hypothetical protein
VKHYFYTLIILSLFSCSKEEPEKPNSPPQAFEVTAKTEGSEVILNWTEAIDADGDAVTYSVVYGDTLVKGLTSRTFIIKDLPYETEITGTVVASDGKGGMIEQVFKLKTSENPHVLIPDVEFEKFLVSEGFDDVLDGKISLDNATLVKELSIYGNIESLEGLEAFSNLETLSFESFSIKKVSFKGLFKLKKAYIYAKVIEGNSVDFNDCYLLEVLDYAVENTRNIDLSNNSVLRTLRLQLSRQLNSLSIDKNINLETLTLNYTGVSSLDLTKNVNLKSVSLTNNPIDKFNFSKNELLQDLKIGYAWNTFPEKVSPRIDLSGLTSIRSLSFEYVGLNNLNISSFSELQSLYLDSINPLEIDISKMIELESLTFRSAGITSINLESNKKLKWLDLSNNAIDELNLSHNSILTNIYIDNNYLSELNLCNQKKVTQLWCRNNNIYSILLNPAIKPTEIWKKDATATVSSPENSTVQK